MAPYLKVLLVDAATGFYRIKKYMIGDFFGPVDLGLHLAGRHNSLNIGTGLLSGSVFPGANRLIFNGFSPCWGSFFISSMGGAGLIFDNLGINLLSIIRQAPVPSLLYLNRSHGEEIEVKIEPIEVDRIWQDGRGGLYGLMDHVYDHYRQRYENDPRILAVGPAARATDFGAIASAPIRKGRVSYVDTWAGRGGFGTKLLLQHGLAAVIYGGTFIEQDFRDRRVVDEWFEQRYQKKLLAKDFEATTKYRFDPKFDTGGTFGVNYAAMGGRIMAFNYRSIYLTEQERLALHEKFILDHYLKQFNEETIKAKNQTNCGEPCVAVCKKLHQEFKKDYEPYQTMGPLCGVFDQRAAEMLNHQADAYGFDAISIGGVLAWLMECLYENLITPEELGAPHRPVFTPDDFNIVEDSRHNAELGCALLENIVRQQGLLKLQTGARKLARQLARERGKKVLDLFIYNANARRGWMVPNQYWTAGALSPMPIMGKYYMYYGHQFVSPRELGRKNARRMLKELSLDNLGICRFHRAWAEDMIPEIIDSLFGLKDEFLQSISMTASRINSRNAAILWESERNMDFIHTFLKRVHQVEGNDDLELIRWIKYFEQDKEEAALEFWFEIGKGVHESLREF